MSCPDYPRRWVPCVYVLQYFVYVCVAVCVVPVVCVHVTTSIVYECEVITTFRCCGVIVGDGWSCDLHGPHQACSVQCLGPRRSRKVAARVSLRCAAVMSPCTPELPKPARSLPALPL
ncbi:uncharacterized protein LOC135107289 [Scylla paramamosain]|uniref:uncharacterized protein LOC135107289 n=1 Tax=Scylla paramamosain TaxID=85552 RepID=UPI0030836E81